MDKTDLEDILNLMLDYYYKNIFEVAPIDNASLISGLGDTKVMLTS